MSQSCRREFGTPTPREKKSYIIGQTFRVRRVTEIRKNQTLTESPIFFFFL